jgi:hypothetical protein
MLDYVDQMRIMITADFRYLAVCATVTQGQAQMQC